MRLRAVIALAVAVVAAVFMSPAAPASAAPGAFAYPPTNCLGSLSVSTTHPLVGETITVSGSNFNAHAAVHLVLHTQSYDLGTFNTDAQGSFTAQVQLPAGVVGAHVIVAVSGAPDVNRCPGVPIQIHNPQPTNTHRGGPPPNANTGTDILLILLAAAALLIAGALIYRSGKRRHGYSGHS
jgi:hypothetical protein